MNNSLVPSYFTNFTIYNRNNVHTTRYSLRNKRVNIAIPPKEYLKRNDAHCGISGNEKADELTKRGANIQQENFPITIKQKKTIIKNMFRVNKILDDYHKLNRAVQVILIRLHTGHNRLNAHMNKKMKLVPSSMCICNIEDQTTEHILQRCPNHNNI